MTVTSGPYSVQELHVFPAQHDRTEALLTHATLERLCVEMNDHVSVQTPVRGERGFANITFVSL